MIRTLIHIARGAIIRSRATWYEKGEKSNKYFLGLESHRGKKSCVRKMFASDGTITINPKKIMKEIEKFTPICTQQMKNR